MEVLGDEVLARESNLETTTETVTVDGSDKWNGRVAQLVQESLASARELQKEEMKISI